MIQSLGFVYMGLHWPFVKRVYVSVREGLLECLGLVVLLVIQASSPWTEMADNREYLAERRLPVQCPYLPCSAHGVIMKSESAVM